MRPHLDLSALIGDVNRLVHESSPTNFFAWLFYAEYEPATPGPGFGRFVSADRTVDYVARLPAVTAPILMVAGDGDVMSDVPSTLLTFRALGSADKTLMRFGRAEGHVADYGHCDLVWSRFAPREVFPPLLDWLDARQPGAAASNGKTAIRPGGD